MFSEGGGPRQQYGLPAPLWSWMTTVVVVLTLAALTPTGV